MTLITPHTLAIVDSLVHLHPDSLPILAVTLTEEIGQEVIGVMLPSELSLNPTLDDIHQIAGMMRKR